MPQTSGLTRQERSRLITEGMKHYKALPLEIKREHPGKHIAISVKTGRFEVSDDDTKLKAFADSLGPDDFLWMTRIPPVLSQT